MTSDAHAGDTLAVLRELLEQDGRPTGIAELRSLLPRIEDVGVTDAANELHRLGLAHRFDGDLYSATISARAAARLLDR